MKILVLANNDVGLYKFRRELLECLVQKDHEVLISLPDGELIPDLKEIGCRYIRTEFDRRGMNPFNDLKLIFRYVFMLRKERPDLVLTYTVKPNIYGGIACQFERIPYLANVTGLGTSIENPGLLQKLMLTLYRIGLRKAKCVFFQNKPNHDFFIKKRIVKRRTAIIPGSGVNIDEHQYERYPSEKEGIRFLFIGRLMKDKGVNELFEAAQEIKRHHKQCSFTLIGDCEENYSKQLDDLEKDGVIRYLGFQKGIHDFIMNSHCTILPSYHEGTANVLLESASCGRPVIATRVTGCVETFDDSITGIGCESNSAADLMRAIEEFLMLPEEKHIEMGRAGRAKMEREFDRNIVVREYLKAIEG